MLHSSRIMSQINNPVARLAQPEPVLHESAGAWPAACLFLGSHRPQEPGEEPVSLSPSCTHPPSLSPAAPQPDQPPGHAGAWQWRGGSVHCGCPLWPSWRRKQGFPGPGQVLPVSSQQLSALGLRVGCSQWALDQEPVAVPAQSCHQMCKQAGGKHGAGPLWLTPVPKSPLPALSYPRAESPLRQSIWPARRRCPPPHPGCSCILICNVPRGQGWCEVAPCYCMGTSGRAIHPLPTSAQYPWHISAVGFVSNRP